MSFVTRKRIVIVDDSRTFQAMLENAFEAREEFRVVGVANDATSAIPMLQSLKPQIVTIDLCMPDVDGEAMLAMLGQEHSVCKIIVSDEIEKNALLTSRLIGLGAAACISKRSLARNNALFFHNMLRAYDKFQMEKEHRQPATPPEPALKIAGGAGADHRTHSAPRIVHFGIPIPADEERRLQLLKELGLANLVPDRQLDVAVRLLATITSFPMCLVTFIDRETLWIKSAHGLPVSFGPREHAFCSYTIAQRGAFVVYDASTDERFLDNPVVTDGMKIRTYAGHPILAEDGTSMGAICLIEQNVTPVTTEVTRALALMAELVGEILRKRGSIHDPAT